MFSFGALALMVIFEINNPSSKHYHHINRHQAANYCFYNLRSTMTTMRQTIAIFSSEPEFTHLPIPQELREFNELISANEVLFTSPDEIVKSEHYGGLGHYYYHSEALKKWMSSASYSALPVIIYPYWDTRENEFLYTVLFTDGSRKLINNPQELHTYLQRLKNKREDNK